MSVISFLTDWGWGDGSVAVAKHVMLGIHPRAQIVDSSHAIPPFNIRHAEIILWRSAPYCSSGTIHLAVVDPGVGTERQGIVAQVGRQYFVGPDNGLITPLLQHAESCNEEIRVFNTANKEFWLDTNCKIFHGRDVFAPVAAHLARGVPLEQFGPPATTVVRLELSHPTEINNSLIGEVIEVDAFGNLMTNIMEHHIESLNVTDICVKIAGKAIKGLAGTFGDITPGTLGALIGTDNDLMITVAERSAEEFLQAGVGTQVVLASECPTLNRPLSTACRKKQ